MEEVVHVTPGIFYYHRPNETLKIITEGNGSSPTPEPEPIPDPGFDDTDPIPEEEYDKEIFENDNIEIEYFKTDNIAAIFNSENEILKRYTISTETELNHFISTAPINSIICCQSMDILDIAILTNKTLLDFKEALQYLKQHYTYLQLFIFNDMNELTFYNINNEKLASLIIKQNQMEIYKNMQNYFGLNIKVLTDDLEDENTYFTTLEKHHYHYNNTKKQTENSLFNYEPIIINNKIVSAKIYKSDEGFIEQDDQGYLFIVDENDTPYYSNELFTPNTYLKNGNILYTDSIRIDKGQLYLDFNQKYFKSYLIQNNYCFNDSNWLKNQTSQDYLTKIQFSNTTAPIKTYTPWLTFTQSLNIYELPEFFKGVSFNMNNSDVFEDYKDSIAPTNLTPTSLLYPFNITTISYDNESTFYDISQEPLLTAETSITTNNVKLVLFNWNLIFPTLKIPIISLCTMKTVPRGMQYLDLQHKTGNNKMSVYFYYNTNSWIQVYFSNTTEPDFNNCLTYYGYTVDRILMSQCIDQLPKEIIDDPSIEDETDPETQIRVITYEDDNIKIQATFDPQYENIIRGFKYGDTQCLHQSDLDQVTSTSRHKLTNDGLVQRLVLIRNEDHVQLQYIPQYTNSIRYYYKIGRYFWVHSNSYQYHQTGAIFETYYINTKHIQTHIQSIDENPNSYLHIWIKNPTKAICISEVIEFITNNLHVYVPTMELAKIDDRCYSVYQPNTETDVYTTNATITTDNSLVTIISNKTTYPIFTGITPLNGNYNNDIFESLIINDDNLYTAINNSCKHHVVDKTFTPWQSTAGFITTLDLTLSTGTPNGIQTYSIKTQPEQQQAWTATATYNTNTHRIENYQNIYAQYGWKLYDIRKTGDLLYSLNNEIRATNDYSWISHVAFYTWNNFYNSMRNNQGYFFPTYIAPNQYNNNIFKFGNNQQFTTQFKIPETSTPYGTIRFLAILYLSSSSDEMHFIEKNWEHKETSGGGNTYIGYFIRRKINDNVYYYTSGDSYNAEDDVIQVNPTGSFWYNIWGALVNEYNEIWPCNFYLINPEYLY